MLKQIDQSISFIIITYNQEEFISDAINSALAQKVLPKEIVIVDDCSTDNTYFVATEIISKLELEIPIKLIRNNVNLGILRNFVTAVDATSGDWITGCAGDDIADENKVETLSNIIHKEDFKNIYAIGTAFSIIDVKNNFVCNQFYNFDNLPEFRSHFFHGAAFAYRRSCFTFFKKITSQIQTEDILLPYRGLLLGGIMLLNTVTTKYRIGYQNISSNYGGSYFSLIKKMLKIKESDLLSYSQRIIDLESINIDEILKSKIKNQIQLDILSAKDDIKHLQKILDFYNKKSFQNFRILIASNQGKKSLSNFKTLLKVIIYSTPFKIFSFFFKSKKINGSKSYIKYSDEKYLILTIKDYFK
ncbi:glycosyltransferase family 2 protein [Algoriphagus aquatilis]|uniref:Glycosyltransferase family 2 protein n=1 Tax=Algoriphagus aquatilis TaxID=490186 RepID=A0ABW0BUA8_9BACT